MPLSDHEKKIFEELTSSLRSEGFAKKLSLGTPRFALLAAITIAALIGAVATFTFSIIAAFCCLAVAYTSALIATKRWLARRGHEFDNSQPSEPHASGPRR